MKRHRQTIKIHNITIKRNNYTRRQKQQIAQTIKPITRDEAISDFNELRARCASARRCAAPGLDRVGNTVVDYFTFRERLETVGNKGINFYDFYNNRRAFSRKKYVRKFLALEGERGAAAEKLYYRLFNFYFGSINAFRPRVAMSIYAQYRPQTVLDMTMGWGGRAIGAAALDVPRYIGIDLNRNLRAPYAELERALAPHTKTKFDFRFCDALTVDYSKLDYDMVFTSPPYYSIEVYQNMKNHETKEEWNEAFYRPLIEKTYAHLKRGGVYALNVPSEVYESACVPILGAAKRRIALKKSTRNIGKYGEFIYIWIRG